MAAKTLVDDERWGDFIERYAFDLTLFTLEVCDMSPTPQQVELFNNVSKPGSRTSVRSGHGTGKSRSIGVAVLWHLLCYYLSNTMITAPKIEQVRNVSWKEITDLQGIIRNGPHAWIADYFTVEAERVYIIGFKPIPSPKNQTLLVCILPISAASKMLSFIKKSGYPLKAGQFKSNSQ